MNLETKYLVWNADDETPEEGREVEAFDPIDAAEQWAEMVDRDSGTYPITASEVDAYVQHPRTKEVVRVCVGGSMAPEYIGSIISEDISR